MYLDVVLGTSRVHDGSVYSDKFSQKTMYHNTSYTPQRLSRNMHNLKIILICMLKSTYVFYVYFYRRLPFHESTIHEIPHRTAD